MREAVARDDSHLGAWLALGILTGRTGRLDEARGAFERVLTLDPAHADARFWLGVVQLHEGDVAAARSQFQALAEDPLVAGALAALSA